MTVQCNGPGWAYSYRNGKLKKVSKELMSLYLGPSKNHIEDAIKVLEMIKQNCKQTWIIGVGYCNNGDDRTDTQLGITGKAFRKEKLKDAAKRELEEETGLRPKRIKSVICETDKDMERGIFQVSVKDLKKVDTAVNSPTNEEQKNRRITVFITCTKTEAINLIQKTQCLDNDDITSYSAIHISDAINISYEALKKYNENSSYCNKLLYKF